MYPELKFFRYICSNLKNSLLYLQFVLSLKHTNLKTTTVIMRELFRNIREAIYYAYYRCREYEDSFDDFPFRGPRRWDNLTAIHVIISFYVLSILFVVFEMNGWDSDWLPEFMAGVLIVLAIIAIVKLDEDQIYKEMKEKYKDDPNRYSKGLAVLFFCLGGFLSLFTSFVICLFID